LKPSPIREAVILAAGKGGRIRERADDLPKPLHEVAGVPLIKRTIMTLARAGITRVHVIIGFMGGAIRSAVEADSAYARAGVEVRFIENPDYERSNGVSVLKARGQVTGPFVLSMSDHVYDESIARRAAGADLAKADLYLCVDRRVGEVYDLEDATKVRTADDRIVDIGKALKDYDCIDCGVFAVSPALFDALERVQQEKGDCSLSEGVRALATNGAARVLDVGQAFWQDVDTPPARRRAEKELIASLRKRVDGPVSRLINRRVSLAITSRLVGTRVTPNQMTVVANLAGALGIYCVLRQTWTAVAIGAVLVQIQSILDGCDGELARLKYQSSRFGEWLDNVLDDHVNVGYGLALGIASATLLDEPLYRWLGIGAASGFTLYNLTVYIQLALVHRTGSPFAFRWWYQKGPQDLGAMLAQPGLGNRVGALLRALGRRDFFLFAFMLLALARLPQVAVVWYALIAAAHAALTAIHLLAGGLRAGASMEVVTAAGASTPAPVGAKDGPA
jgi:1L-myo-inositol 1-phosphate cytidylyltransferase / CDP-L-myo-inositol myo-inositolphosphotransferase